MKKLLLVFTFTVLLFNLSVIGSFPAKNNIHINKTEGCDNIILKSGKEISANVLEITVDQIKYRRCNNNSGPIVSVSKKDVFMIKYKDGYSEKIESSGTSVSNNDDEGLKSGAMGVAALWTGIASLIFAGVILGPAAIVFGAIGMNKDRKKRKSAIWGLALGSVGFLAALIILGSM